MLIYAITIFLSAFLLFQVQPILAKYILPWFGGTPAVWTTCILFFQTVLLAGYAYAHVLTTRLPKRYQALFHVSLVSISLVLMAFLTATWQSPITPGASWKPRSVEHPSSDILLLLLVSVGLPYFLLSTSGPLLQAWFARTRPGNSPYRLYALSNLGSLLALVSYPFVVEPALTLRTQARTWSLAYVVFAAAISLCALLLHRAPEGLIVAPAHSTPGADLAKPSAGTRALWVALPACASVMLLASTNQICQEVAVVPFLWVLPLVLYLLSFIICFDSDRWYRRAVFHPALILALFGAVYTLYGSVHMPLALQVAAYSFLLFAICMVCHGELARLKPATRYLTSFYLMISLGGALGGIFVGLIAPHIFTGFWEFYLGLWAAPALLVVVLWREGNSWVHRRNPVLTVVIASLAVLLPEVVGAAVSDSSAAELHKFRPGEVLVVLLTAFVVFRRRQSAFSVRRPGWVTQVSLLLGLGILASSLVAYTRLQVRDSLLTTRNFYGSLAVVERNSSTAEDRCFVLRHGRILHGLQFADREKRMQATTYFGPASGIGVLLANYPAAAQDSSGVRIGIVGLGIGTISAWARAGDYIRYYEINPEVIRIASDPRGYFSYIRDCPARLEIVPGDARVSMEREVAGGNSQRFDVLAIDAFTADTIPVHLLTREAFETYFRELKPEGVLAIHISNRYLDLRPVLWRQAEEYRLKFAYIHSPNQPPFNSMADWVLLTRNDRVLQYPEIARAIVPHTEFTEPPLWTDNYSNLFQMLRHDQLGGELATR